MNAKDVLDTSPRNLQVGDGPTATYALAEDLIASHGDAAARGADGLDGGSIAVAPVEEATASASGLVGPVYRQSPGGALAIPTGRILVRFPDGESAAEHQKELANAGFVVEQVLPYAPQAAWVRVASGEISESLQALDRLAALPSVEHVEPQIVSKAYTR